MHEKIQKVDALKKKLIIAGKKFSTIDGVRVEEAFGWWLVRASNTQNALIIRAEGNTPNDLKIMIDQMKEFGFNLDGIFKRDADQAF